MMIGCGDESEPRTHPALTESASPTQAATASPTASSTEAAEADGEEGFRAFASQIAAAVQSGDGGFFADRGIEDELVCDGSEELGPCVDQAPGAILRGIPGGVAQSDAFALVTPEDYAVMISQWIGSSEPGLDDAYGNGAAALFAVAYRPANAFQEEVHQAIMSGIYPLGPVAEKERQARVLGFQFVDGTWRLTEDLLATRELTAEPYLTGECCPDGWEPWDD